MADKKISALTAATTPLAGTEVLPIVQSSATVKVAVSDLTAGRAVNALSVTSTNDVSANGVTVGKGGGSISTNAALGTSALTANTTGSKNTAVGYQALLAETNSVDVTALGYQAGAAINGNNGSTFLGSSTGATATGAYNTLVGVRAGKALTSGGGNTFVGASAATGDGAGAAVTTGTYNVIIGGYAGTASMSQNIVLSDGFGNIGMQFDATNWSFAGNISPTTAAKGVNFTANTPAAGMTSQLLNWYEEGTWTVTFTNLTLNAGSLVTSGTYTRIGRVVYFSVRITSGTTSSTANSTSFNLPFTSFSVDSTLTASNSGNVDSYGVGLIQGSTGYTPTWSSKTNVTISGSYQV